MRLSRSLQCEQVESSALSAHSLKLPGPGLMLCCVGPTPCHGPGSNSGWWCWEGWFLRRTSVAHKVIASCRSLKFSCRETLFLHEIRAGMRVTVPADKGGPEGFTGSEF